jgi:hypothetical protein
MNSEKMPVVNLDEYIKYMTRTGIEPATQGFSVLKIHFCPLPWIALNRPRCPNSIGKVRFFPENIGNRKQSKSTLGNWQLRWISVVFQPINRRKLPPIKIGQAVNKYLGDITCKLSDKMI